MSRSLSGRWKGYYLQGDKQRGLEADLLQLDDELTGVMRDEQTYFEKSIYELTADCGLPPGADEQIIGQLRQKYPEYASEPIRALMTLPESAEITGRVQERTVTFRKTYQGTSFSGYLIGRKRVGSSKVGHSVLYRGTVSLDGQTIEGIWWIEADAREGVRRTEGPFLFHRGKEE